MEFLVCYFFVALDSQILYINAQLRAESIDASSMRIACKMAKLFTCLGGPTQLGQSIVLSHSMMSLYDIIIESLNKLTH